jgi:large subunit ribosomal protein L10
VKTRLQKEKEIEVLHREFDESPNALLVGFQGIKVSADERLRRELRQANISYRVVKNTLAIRAAEGTPMDQVKSQFEGATAMDVKDIESLSNLPSKEELISKVMFLINSSAQRLAVVTAGVARNLTIVIDQVRAQKESEG